MLEDKTTGSHQIFGVILILYHCIVLSVRPLYNSMLFIVSTFGKQKNPLYAVPDSFQ